MSRIVNDYRIMFNPEMKSWQALLLQARVDLVVIVMRGYATFPKYPGVEPYHQMV